MNLPIMKKSLLLACLALTASVQLQAQPQLTPSTIDEVLKAMTLDEKAKLLVGPSRAGYDINGNLKVSKETLVPGVAGQTQEIGRLGIVATALADGPAGLRINPSREGETRAYYCTGFPVGTALASTWNTQLVENVGKAMGNEVLEYGVDVLLAPGMNIHRNPLCGRNFEYYSEDPVVSGRIAAAFVNGVQSNGVGTSIKHYAANNQETNRMGNDARVSQRALREIYLKPFEIAVKEARPWTVMSSYNRINGPYTQEDKELLTTVLRDEWGFDGIVMTDWTGPRNTAAQVAAGNDLMEPGYPAQSQEIIDKVKSGELSLADVDLSVRRMLEYIVKTPRFKRYPYSDRPDMKAHAAVTRQSATEGMVLLKNEGRVLPIRQARHVSLFGISSYDLIAGGTGSGNVHKPYVIDLVQGLEEAGFRVNADARKLYETYKAYQNAEKEGNRPATYVNRGKEVLPEMPVSRVFIDKQARASEMAIVTLGRNSGEGFDRHIDNDFNLTRVERQLLNDVVEAFHEQGKKVVVILNIGGVIETASWKMLPDAILLAWQPGQEAGYSIADILTGKANPSGKLTMTFPIHAIDHLSTLNFPYDYEGGNYAAPVFSTGGNKKNVDYTDYEEDIWVGYRYFNSRHKQVSYPFGYGLSYTTFAYSNPKVKATPEGFEASVTVRNTGEVAGKEVVQLYVSAPQGELEKPAAELKAFAKTRELKPGESQTLTLRVSHYELASYNEVFDRWVTDPGTYQVKFASNVENIRATQPYSVKKELSWQMHDVLKPKIQLKKARLFR